VLHKVKGKGT